MTEIDTKEIHGIRNISVTSLVRRTREGRAPPVSNAPANNVIVFSSVAIPIAPCPPIKHEMYMRGKERERKREKGENFI